MSSFTFSYPAWFLIFCLAAGLLYSFILYRKDLRFEDKPSWLKLTLKLLRFLSIALISFLLLTPIFKSEKTEKKNPLIVLLRDQSQSIKLGNKLETLAGISTYLNQLKSKVSNKFQIVDLEFGDQTNEYRKDSFNYKITNISQAIDYISGTFADQNLGALVVVSDGIYNEGSNPVYASAKLKSPMYTIGLGDTSIRKDLSVTDVLHNKIAYLGDKFVVNVGITANNSKGNGTKVMLYSEADNGTLSIVGEKIINVANNIDYQTLDFNIEANKVGLAKYIVSIVPVSGEYLISNNKRSFFVEVIDARQKLLIMANSPHPDVAALHDIITANKNYEVTSAFSYDQGVKYGDFDLVIFHNLPSSNFDISPILKILDTKGVNRLYLAGSQIDQQKFNGLQDVIKITGGSSNIEVIEPSLISNFDKFTLSDDTRKRIPTYPPLTAVFGSFNLGPLSSSLMNQRIKKVPTNNPLFAFEEKNGKRTGVFAAEGIWKWRMQDMVDYDEPRYLGEIINKTIQYLSVKDDKRRFRVNASKTIYRENESINLDAQLYNDSYEMVNTPEVDIVIKNRNGQEYKYNFSKVNNYYTLNAGILPPGSYQYQAKTSFDGKSYEAIGKFSIESIDLELNNITAQHSILKTMSSESGGQHYHHTNYQGLTEAILSNDKLKPTLYSSISTNLLMDKKWYFFILLMLLGLEWFLRRYFGSY